MAAQVNNNTAWLEWMEGLLGAGSRATQRATPSPEQFYCSLERLPLHLIPQWHRRFFLSHEDRAQALFLNPQCLLLPPGQFPAEVQAYPDLVKKFSLHASVAWVRDPCTLALQPFWLGSCLENIVSDLRAEEPISDSVSQHVRSALAAAGILIRENENESRTQAWSEKLKERSAQFRNKAYAPLSGLIHPFNLAALRRYYRHEIRRGAIPLGDHQSSRRYVAHNESVARFFHHQMTNAVSAIVGQTIKPSYVYFASYLSGAELKKHIDREQCEFSVTLSLDFSPEPDLATSWPIRLETPTGTATVYQALGDGLVYRGTKVPHYRNRLPEGHTSTSIFFHYVPAKFNGSLE
jgi:hypothetical protein